MRHGLAARDIYFEKLSSHLVSGVVLKFQPIRRTYFTMAAILHFDLHQQHKFERSVSRSQDDNRFKVMTIKT
jgi:hypothetical protein